MKSELVGTRTRRMRPPPTPGGQSLGQAVYQRFPDEELPRGARSSRGLASFTVSARPCRSVPLRLLIACFAASVSGISIKAKPRERMVSRSVTTCALDVTMCGERIAEVIITGVEANISDEDSH
mgnify:CR=1 FL=1